MQVMTTRNRTVLLRVIGIFLLCGNAAIGAAFESGDSKINQDAFVYILNMGISGRNIQYKGLRNGFAVGNGQYVLTAAHCVTDFENSNHTLMQPWVISPYYGDAFEAEIAAIDKENDIAILKPAWDFHPALELETSEDWKRSEALRVIGYPPAEPCRGGNGSISRQILSEEVCLRYTSGKNARQIVAGPCHYPGVGWSGSPFLNPETGKVVGIFCRGDYYEQRRYFFFKKKQLLHSGPSVNSIEKLFKNSPLSYTTPEASSPKLNQRAGFERILSALETFKPDNEKQTRTAFQDLCKEMPDSCFPYIVAGLILEPPDDKPCFDKAIEMNPEGTFVRAAYGDKLLPQKPKKAAEQFHIVTQRDPNHIFAYHGQLASLVLTEPNAAEVLGRELTQRWPQNAGFCFEYSRALRANNKRKEELPVIQKAVELSEQGTVPFVYQRYLADCLAANARCKEAQQAYMKLLKTHECEACWRAYTDLLLKMGPEKAQQVKEAITKAKSFNQDPNTILEKYCNYERALEKMLSDPNAAVH